MKTLEHPSQGMINSREQQVSKLRTSLLEGPGIEIPWLAHPRCWTEPSQIRGNGADICVSLSNKCWTSFVKCHTFLFHSWLEKWILYLNWSIHSLSSEDFELLLEAMYSFGWLCTLKRSTVQREKTNQQRNNKMGQIRKRREDRYEKMLDAFPALFSFLAHENSPELLQVICIA